MLGVGARVQRMPENVKAFLRSKAIALEVQDTVCGVGRGMVCHICLMCVYLSHCSPMHVPPLTFFLMKADRLEQHSSLLSFCNLVS